MCDTIVAVGAATSDGSVLFGKNSDREPGEAQLVECIPAQRHSTSVALQCTHLAIPQTEHTNAIAISRPFWMWGAEMGANEYGLVIGNEAVFTKVPVAKNGLTGMDLVRLALERTTSAREGLELITDLLGTVGQGGACGYRNKKFRYHNSFLLADATEAWVLETAGPYWAAERVRGVRTISNALSIQHEFDLLGEGTYEAARAAGWCKNAKDFAFAGAFADPLYTLASGGRVRRACTTESLGQKTGKLEVADLHAALISHNGKMPHGGWRMEMPCAHASWLPTRQAGQTTGSMLSRLSKGEGTPRQQAHWFTGTSAPCLSVFKPVELNAGEGPNSANSANSANSDSYVWGSALGQSESNSADLFWLHERFHRAVLDDYATLALIGEAERQALQNKCFAHGFGQARSVAQAAWQSHASLLKQWILTSKTTSVTTPNDFLTSHFWQKQNQLDCEHLFNRQMNG